MTITAFDGAAGSGKTWSVIDQLCKELSQRPLETYQRVLALTFMHGARHRLDNALDRMRELGGRYDALTLDSFTWRVCRRWRSRIRERGWTIPAPDDYAANCEIATRLLTDADVRTWVASSYPIVIIDEAQDLERQRLAIVDELIKASRVLLAFDEFQCLNSSNRPVAIASWVVGKCTPTILTGSKRTNDSSLLKAALEVRQGATMTLQGASFKVVAAPHRKGLAPALAATLIGYEIAKGGTFALLTPSTKSAYATGIVEVLRQGGLGKDKKLGPFQIDWESGTEDGIDELKHALDTLKGLIPISQVEGIIASYAHVPAAESTRAMLARMRDVKAIEVLAVGDVVAMLNRNMQTARQFRRHLGGKRALTIHQAKNREFDRVAVIWPYQIPRTPDDRRRSLYNAITRARLSCIVIAQAPKLLKEPPFV